MHTPSRTHASLALSGILALSNACGSPQRKENPSGDETSNAVIFSQYLDGLNSKLITILKTAHDAGNCSTIPMDGNRSRLLCSGLGGSSFSLTVQSSNQIGCAIDDASDPEMFPDTSLFFTPDSLPHQTRMQIAGALCENRHCMGEKSTDDDLLKVLGSAIDVCETLNAVLAH